MPTYRYISKHFCSCVSLDSLVPPFQFSPRNGIPWICINWMCKHNTAYMYIAPFKKNLNFKNYFGATAHASLQNLYNSFVGLKTHARARFYLSQRTLSYIHVHYFIHDCTSRFILSVSRRRFAIKVDLSTRSPHRTHIILLLLLLCIVFNDSVWLARMVLSQ